MDREALGDRIAELAAQITAVTYTLLVAIREFDEAGGWHQHGAISCAQWLSWRIGMSPGMAREKVRVARALSALPLISKRFEEGRLSYSKVRALVRVATPVNEADLVNVAMSTTASDLERICRRFRSVLERERSEAEGPEDAEARRFVRHRYTEDGMVRLTIQVPADEGARLLAAIKSGALAAAGGDSAETRKRMNRTDGLMAVAESFLSDGARPRTGGAPNEVQLHVSKAELAEKSEGALIANAGDVGVSAETARRLCCDAGVVGVTEDAQGKVLDAGRRTRTVPSAIRRALNRRHDSQCAFPGCTNHLFLDAHHIEHWADGGKTSLDNLILVCRRHHTFVHEYGYTVELGEDGAASFSPPGRPALPRAPVPAHPCPSDLVERIAEAHTERGLSLNEVCLIPPHYDGEPIDYEETIADLCWASRPERPAPPSTTPPVESESTA